MPRDLDKLDEAATLKRMNTALKRALNTPHKPHKPLKYSKRKQASSKPKNSTSRNSERAPDQIVFSVAALESLSSHADSELSCGVTSDRLEVSIRPYVGSALPAFDNGVVGYVIRENNGRKTFLALK
jgi:hypothetical protein